MKNFIVSYDLNGAHPTHAEMDRHIQQGCLKYARILETVWYVKRSGTAAELSNYLSRILSPNDRLMVVEGTAAVFQNLLVQDQAVIDEWNNRLAA